MDSDVNNLLSAEFRRFELQRKPTQNVKSFWKGAEFLLLRRAAIILLSVPASSVAVERLFSEAGLILTKLRRHLDPLARHSLRFKARHSFYHLEKNSW